MSASEASLASATAVVASLIEQPRDSNAALGCLVVVEGERRRALGPRFARDRCLENAMRGAESRERRLTFGVIAEDADVDPRRAEVGTCIHGGNGHEANPRVLELGRYR